MPLTLAERKIRAKFPVKLNRKWVNEVNQTLKKLQQQVGTRFS
jgi:IS30 family transposase